MNNTTPIKILTAAVLLTFGFALTAFPPDDSEYRAI